MADGALRILSIGLLALLYLFFLRAMRAVWVETRAADRRAAQAAVPAAAQAVAPGAPPARTTRPRPAATLRTIEPVDLRGRRHDIGDEVTLGRAPGCQVRVEDDYVSQLHARLHVEGDQVVVEDLGSTNGTFVGDERVTGPRVVRPGEWLRVGSFVFEVEA
ncbi:MAG: FHA domain-containing protein [Actinomycetota bacterium]